MKNALFKILVRCLRGRLNIAMRGKRFLVVSTTGLGDTLWATPAIRSLRESFPSSFIAVLTTPFGKEVLLHNRHIDEIITAQEPLMKSFLSLRHILRKKQFSDVLVFHTSQRPILPLVSTIGASRIVGTEGINKGLDFLFTDLLDNRTSHEIKRRLEIVSRVGAHPLDPHLEFHCSQEDEKEAEIFLSQFQLPPYLPLINLHPGAKDGFKQWPASHFIDLGNRLSDHLGALIFVTGNPSEKPLVEEIASHIRGAIPVTDLKLRTLAAFIKRMELVITNDTGPMHIAFAMQTPTVALFTPTNPQLCGPLFTENVTVIAKKATCTPCLKKKCREPFCLLQIGVQEVYDAALELFYRSAACPPCETPKFWEMQAPRKFL